MPFLVSQIFVSQTGNTAAFMQELGAQSLQVLNYTQASGLIIDQTSAAFTVTEGNNYVFLPPINVNVNAPFMNSITSFQPSPDWFTGFYLFDTIDSTTQNYWQRFTLRTYPFDAGVDNGESYTATPSRTDPPGNVQRFNTSNVPKDGAFLSADGSSVLPVAEYDCVLNVCPADQPKCQLANFPPSNFCDILKYPSCATYCNPSNATCQQCQGNGYEASTVYFTDCCLSGHEPKSGMTCEQMLAATSGNDPTGLPSLAAWSFLVMMMILMPHFDVF